jgi:hypothetical protein
MTDHAFSVSLLNRAADVIAGAHDNIVRQVSGPCWQNSGSFARTPLVRFEAEQVAHPVLRS